MHEEALLIRIKLADDEFGEYDERESVYALEDQLRALLDDASVGECDGHEFGAGYATIFCYGRDANALLAECFPVVGSQKLAAGSHLVIRTGPPGAPERRVELGELPAV